MIPVAPRRPPGASDRFKVFLSHANADKDLVLLARDQLEALGVQAYLAEQDPRPGTPLASKIEKAIEDADITVVLLTDEGSASNYVQHEVATARTLGKLVIPLVSSNVDPRRLGILADVERIELDQDNPAAALVTMAAGLRPLLDKHQADVLARREAELREKHQAALLAVKTRERAGAVALEAQNRAEGFAFAIVIVIILALASRKGSA